VDFKTFQEESRRTATYPGLNESIEYPLMGLIGEMGELSEKFKKVLRDNNGAMSQDRIDGIIGELGDLCWYLFQIYSELKIDLQNNYTEMSIDKNKLNSTLSVLVAINCCVSDIAIYCLSSNKTLIGELTNNANTLISLIKEVCRLCNVSIEEVMDYNIKKLQDRLKRGVIKGDGDKR
jgi:NTP pyrophosphatase (non-canonical NTP hydrolase)